MSSYELNDNEKRIRKNWLILTFMNSLGIRLLSIVAIAILFDEVDSEFYTGSSILLSLSLVSFMIFYYFTYRKHKTGWLTFVLWAVPLPMLKSLIDVWRTPDFFSDNILPYATLLDIGIFVWWYILSLKLRKINKEIQSFYLRSTPDYSQAMSIFQGASTLEQLNASFGSLIREKDKGESSGKTAIIEAYKAQKKLLNLNQATNS